MDWVDMGHLGGGVIITVVMNSIKPLNCCLLKELLADYLAYMWRNRGKMPLLQHWQEWHRFVGAASRRE